MTDRDNEFVDYVKARGAALRRTAFLLCGDWHRAEDLVQSALLKLFRAWPKIRADDAVDAYARKILVRTAIDESRRLWRKREWGADDLPEVAAPHEDHDGALDARRALGRLPVRQRAAVVLRYWEDLPVEEVAQLLGCAEGTVKSQCAKGLASLRRMLRDEMVLEGPR
ncbi:RNA polymerase sigma-70 factor, sigma-E family [Actinokineospora alba]|uniref:RNA polymerase sigma-70 factor, sigma-E family n=1 Tax=Actinokineospora alba TaxID=504798 RepID=A0A1H0HU22_9PSEU|nr:SigE family RNA polymerase sigma factor [Actinokineospora alba]TDP64746.1 RNA polymerase sigma-70 factor (sigma-E family) [Actinokineospora alba]SDH44866.1 RNA polymerase sigma-70 factor, sigma-E family [Actinokineospora alba]SDO22647.1 RNA polymerase sigma-70 factor, sigma-E family [Actinokineospora alba]